MGGEIPITPWQDRWWGEIGGKAFKGTKPRVKRINKPRAIVFDGYEDRVKDLTSQIKVTLDSLCCVPDNGQDTSSIKDCVKWVEQASQEKYLVYPKEQRPLTETPGDTRTMGEAQPLPTIHLNDLLNKLGKRFHVTMEPTSESLLHVKGEREDCDKFLAFLDDSQ